MSNDLVAVPQDDPVPPKPISAGESDSPGGLGGPVHPSGSDGSGKPPKKPLTFNERATIGIGIVSAIAAIASAVCAYKLYALDDVQREFTRKSNASIAMATWQVNVSQKAASGYKCQLFLGKLDKDQFEHAIKKEAYDVSGESRLKDLRGCLDRENAKDIKDLSETIDSPEKNSKSIHVPKDVSFFITTQALDYLNFTEAVFLQWKYRVADPCIIEGQIGEQTVSDLWDTVQRLQSDYRSMVTFHETYPTVLKVQDSISRCEADFAKANGKAEH